jgi:hypothetical protein
MHRTSKRRLVGGAAGLLLIGATLLSTGGVALAAPSDGTTRHLYVGSDSNFVSNPGILSLTPVSAGQSTVTNVFVKNVDNQTLNHVVLTFNVAQTNLSIADKFGPNSGSCNPVAGVMTCDFGSLKARAERRFSLVLTATGAGAGSLHGTFVFNESNNPNGGNTQINDLNGAVTVGAASCDSLATFLPPGIAKTLVPDDGTACSGDGQRSGLKVPPNANGTTVEIDDDTLAVGCGTFECFGNAVSAVVNSGAPVSPYLTWQIFYSNSVLGNINPKQVGFLHDGTLIQAGNKGLCKNASSVNCQEPYVVSSAGVTFLVRTPSNGAIKGIH